TTFATPPGRPTCTESPLQGGRPCCSSGGPPTGIRPSTTGPTTCCSIDPLRSIISRSDAESTFASARHWLASRRRQSSPSFSRPPSTSHSTPIACLHESTASWCTASAPCRWWCRRTVDTPSASPLRRDTALSSRRCLPRCVDDPRAWRRAAAVITDIDGGGDDASLGDHMTLGRHVLTALPRRSYRDCRHG